MNSIDLYFERDGHPHGQCSKEGREGHLMAYGYIYRSEKQIYTLSTIETLYNFEKSIRTQRLH